METIHLGDGRSFLLRPLRPDDLEALRRAFLRLTPEEIEYRFFYRSRGLRASVMAQIRGFDPAREAAFVVDDAGEIRAVADLHADAPGAREAEFGLIVGNAISGNGIGRRLMLRLLEEARRRHIAALVGSVRTDNTRMLELCRDLGAVILPVADDPATLHARFELEGFPALLK
ncbi:MAG TPA: GNAT family N-acetyltransferase [Rhodanobacteraceae bacterium]|nr:GNAT family N-acetyltransferase [Rhodanobacteraceae bacterium]